MLVGLGDVFGRGYFEGAMIVGLNEGPNDEAVAVVGTVDCCTVVVGGDVSRVGILEDNDMEGMHVGRQLKQDGANELLDGDED